MAFARIFTKFRSSLPYILWPCTDSFGMYVNPRMTDHWPFPSKPSQEYGLIGIYGNGDIVYGWKPFTLFCAKVVGKSWTVSVRIRTIGSERDHVAPQAKSIPGIPCETVIFPNKRFCDFLPINISFMFQMGCIIHTPTFTPTVTSA